LTVIVIGVEKYANFGPDFRVFLNVDLASHDRCPVFSDFAAPNHRERRNDHRRMCVALVGGRAGRLELIVSARGCPGSHSKARSTLGSEPLRWFGSGHQPRRPLILAAHHDTADRCASSPSCSARRQLQLRRAISRPAPRPPSISSSTSSGEATMKHGVSPFSSSSSTVGPAASCAPTASATTS